MKDKEQQLLDILLKQRGIMTANDYSKILGVSSRSVYTYLNNISSILANYNLQIVKIPAVGIKIVKINDHSDSTAVEVENDDFSMLNRRFELINRILVNRETIDIESFADEYYVSTSTIRNDINNINSRLNGFGSYQICINKKFASFEFTSTSELVTLLINLNDELENNNMYMNNVYSSEVVEMAQKIVNDYISMLQLTIAEHYVDHITNVIVTLISQVSNGNHIENNGELLQYDQIKNLANNLLAKQLLQCVELELQIKFNDSDTDFLANYLRADRFQISNIDKTSDTDRYMYGIFLSKIEKILDIKLNLDDDYVLNLLTHFNAMVYRMRHNILIKNSLLDNIKQEFPVLFNLLQLVMENFKDDLKIEVTDDEIGFLLVHIQNIIENQKQIKNILVVCPHGLVISRLITNKIRDLLPLYNVIETIDIDRVSSVKLDSVDFVISTADIKNIDIPVVRVSPIISNTDVKNIMSFYQDLVLNSKNTYSTNYHYLNNYIDEKYLYDSFNEDKETIFKYVIDDLIRDGIVQEDYQSSIIKREQISSCDNVYGFAIPHGDFNLVNKTKIAIVLLNKAINYQKYNVNVIVFFNICRDDLQISKKILEDIFNLMRNEQFQEIRMEGITKDLFKKVIGRE